jgi:sugar phosphate permease
MAFLYSGSLLSGAFSGFISAGIQAGMDGLRGLEAWRWMFLIEGAITVVAGAIAIFVLPDYPATYVSLTRQALIPGLDG